MLCGAHAQGRQEEDRWQHETRRDECRAVVRRKLDPAVTKECVLEVVKRYSRCQSIDPAYVRHEGGDLGVVDIWQRLTIDVTHYKREHYLTVLYFGPGVLRSGGG